MTPCALTTVWATFQFPGHHYWPDPPPQFAYLGNIHRHMFHVRIEVAVTHDNRYVEFIELRNRLYNYCLDTYSHAVFTFSCEQLAEQIADVARDAGYIVVSASVSEDGENGATKYYTVGILTQAKDSVQ